MCRAQERAQGKSGTPSALRRALANAVNLAAKTLLPDANLPGISGQFLRTSEFAALLEAAGVPADLFTEVVLGQVEPDAGELDHIKVLMRLKRDGVPIQEVLRRLGDFLRLILVHVQAAVQDTPDAFLGTLAKVSSDTAKRARATGRCRRTRRAVPNTRPSTPTSSDDNAVTDDGGDLVDASVGFKPLDSTFAGPASDMESLIGEFIELFHPKHKDACVDLGFDVDLDAPLVEAAAVEAMPACSSHASLLDARMPCLKQSLATSLPCSSLSKHHALA